MAKHKRRGGKDEAAEREELIERFVENLGTIMRMRGSIFRKAMSEHGVTLPQFFLIKMVGAHGELSVTRLSGMMMVAPPTASRMIDALSAKGLLRRRKDPQNRRVTYVGLTRRGEEIMRRLWDMHKAEFLRLMRDEDVEGLRDLVLFMEGLTRRLAEQMDGEGDGDG